MPVAVMPEARRREYLAALGIPLFVARVPLPGAAASVFEEQVALVVEAGAADTAESALASPSAPELVAAPAAIRSPASVAAPAVAPATRQPLPALAEAAALLQKPLRRSVPEPAVAPLVASEAGAPARASASPAAAEQTGFSCRLFQVSPGLAVLLDLGEWPDLGAPERQLWQAICRAFDWQPRQLAGDFTWPLANTGRGGMIGAGPDAARAFLQGWLGRDLAPGDRLLVLGPTMATLIERPHRLLPSLAELLASPLAKRALWRLLSAPV